MFPILINQSNQDENLGFNLPSSNSGAIFGNGGSNGGSGGGILSQILGTVTTIGGQIRDTRVGVAQANNPNYYASQLPQYSNQSQTQNLAPSTVVNAAGGALDNLSDFVSRNLVIIGFVAGGVVLYKMNSK